MGIICDLVTSLTPGFVGADLANVVNEAALLAARRGGETVAREDIMEAFESAKFGINDKQRKPSTISKELGKLFPWIPSVIGRNDNSSEDGLQGPMGYQSVSGGYPDCLFNAEGLHQCLPPKKLVPTRDHSPCVRILDRHLFEKIPPSDIHRRFWINASTSGFVKDAAVVRSSLYHVDAKSISPILSSAVLFFLFIYEKSNE